MKKMILIILVFICYDDSLFANGNSKTTSIRALNCFDKTKTNSLEIIHMPSYVLTRTAVTSEQLIRSYNYKFDIVNLNDAINNTDLINAINSVAAEKTEVTGDLRWGILISQDKKPSCSIYFNSSGEYGEINNKRYHFKKNDILPWFKVKFKFIMEND